MATIRSLLRDRVTLQVRSVDRLFLQAYVPKLQSVGWVCQFLRWQRGYPIPSSSAFGKIGDGYVRAVHRFAEANDIPVIHFGKGDNKEAIARPIGTRNPDPVVAQLEDELFELLNETGIGPMGLGGDVTVLQCHIEHADTHMTLNPVAVNYQCWAARRASAHISADGEVEFDREA